MRLKSTMLIDILYIIIFFLKYFILYKYIMRNILYGGHTKSKQGSSCSSCGCGDINCPICNKKKYKKPKRTTMPIQIGSGARSSGARSSSARSSGGRGNGDSSSSSSGSSSSSTSSTTTGNFAAKCQDITDQNVCNRSQILNANNLPTTGQVLLQTCGYNVPDNTCYPIEAPINMTKIINVDPNVPKLLSILSTSN